MVTKPTGKFKFFGPCPWCRGTGRTPQFIDGWYVCYSLQDGHEECGPYTEEQAVGHYTATNPNHNVTLVGPDGQIYEVCDGEE